MKKIKLGEVLSTLRKRYKVAYLSSYNEEQECGCPMYCLAEELGMKRDLEMHTSIQVINFLLDKGYSGESVVKFMRDFDDALFTGNYTPRSVGRLAAKYLLEKEGMIKHWRFLVR